MSKVIGIIRYEVLMAWRRGSTRMILFLMLALPIATYFYTSDMWLKGIECMCDQFGEPLSAEAATLFQTYASLSALLLVVPVLMLIVPVMIADTIPLDRHYGINQILNTLPMSTYTYLLGKVGAALTSVIGALGVGVALWGGVIAFRHYAPNVEALLIIGLALLILAFSSTALGVLVPAVSPSRRQAVAWGFAAAFAATIFSTMLPLYSVARAALIQASEITSTFPASYSAGVREYPDPFSGAFLINYGIILFVITVTLGIVLRRMQTSEAPI